MNKMLIKQYCIAITLLASALPTVSYAYNNMNVNQGMIMPPPGPYRSVNNVQHKPQLPVWGQQQKNIYMRHHNQVPTQNMMGVMPEWMKKQQQQHNEKMQSLFEQRKAEFEKHQMQSNQQSSAPKLPEWVKKRRADYQERIKKMQLKHQENMPKTFVEWEKNKQAEIKRHTEEFKQHQLEAERRAEEFRKKYSANNNAIAQTKNPPEWFVKQQQQAQKQMEFYRAQQQKWMAQQAQYNQARWTAQHQPKQFSAPNYAMPPQGRPMPMPRQYRQMNPNRPPWAYPQYQPAPRR